MFSNAITRATLHQLAIVSLESSNHVHAVHYMKDNVISALRSSPTVVGPSGFHAERMVARAAARPFAQPRER